MKDTIYRQAAIDEWKNDFKGYVNALNIPRDDYNGIMEYIDELPSAQPEQQWIPCSETIDIPDHEVLCCDKYGEEFIGWLSYLDDQWLCESDGSVMYDPKAWCELPEPYREEGENE